MATIDELHARATAAHLANDCERATVLLKSTLSMMDQAGCQDSRYADVLFQLATATSDLETDKKLALMYAERAIRFLGADDEPGEGVLYRLAICEEVRAKQFDLMGKTTDTIAAYERAIAYYAQSNNPRGSLQPTIGIANACFRTGDVARGLACVLVAEKAVAILPELTKRLNLSQQIARANGNLLQLCGRLPEALDALRSDLDFERQLNGAHSSEAACSLICIASILIRSGDLDGAAATLNDAFLFLEMLGLTVSLHYASALEKRGCLLERQHHYAKSLEAHEGCLDLRRRLGSTLDNVFSSLEATYLMLNRLIRREEAADRLAEAQMLRRRSQTACAGPGCSRKLREDAGGSSASVSATAGRRARPRTGRRATGQSARC